MVAKLALEMEVVRDDSKSFTWPLMDSFGLSRKGGNKIRVPRGTMEDWTNGGKSD